MARARWGRFVTASASSCLEEGPNARPLGAELYPGLFGIGLELWDGGNGLGAIELPTVAWINDPGEEVVAQRA